MEIEAMTPNIKQNEVTKQLNGSSSTLQPFRDGTNMLCFFKIPSNIDKRRQKNSNEDLKRSQMTSIDLKCSQKTLLNQKQNNSKEWIHAGDW